MKSFVRCAVLGLALSPAVFAKFPISASDAVIVTASRPDVAVASRPSALRRHMAQKLGRAEAAQLRAARKGNATTVKMIQDESMAASEQFAASVRERVLSGASRVDN